MTDALAVLSHDEPLMACGLTVRASLVAYVVPEVMDLAQGALASHKGNDQTNRLSILIAPAAPPTHGVRNDREVESFIATGPWTRGLFGIRTRPENLCYHALHQALACDTLPVIDIVSGASPPIPSPQSRTVEAIVPHRGASSHLAACISGLVQQTMPCMISLGLDQRCDDAHRAIITSSDHISAFGVHNPPQGPYVIRQFLARRSNADFIAFQDSDDASLPTRLAELTDAAIISGADIVGCHELRLDEIEQAVFAIRFPLDVNAALEVSASHPQFFPTTVVNTIYFVQHGGFSTDMRFGADTEFLLRSHFTARIRNIDRFLYIRRRRAGSLTTAPDTALGSPVRRALDRQWKCDFAAIKRGALDLQASSLALRHAAHPACFERL